MYKMNAPAKDDNSNKLFRSRIDFFFYLYIIEKKYYKFKLRRGAIPTKHRVILKKACIRLVGDRVG